MLRSINKLLVGLFLSLMVVMPVYAATTYQSTISVAESNGSSYTLLPIIASADVSALSSNGFIATNGLNTDIEGITGNHLLATDKIIFVAPIAANSNNSFLFKTNQTPLTSMPIILGHGGFWATVDSADMELGNNFEVEWDGYINTAAGGAPISYNIVYKQDAFYLYVSAVNTVTASMSGTEVVLDETQAGTLSFATYTRIAQRMNSFGGTLESVSFWSGKIGTPASTIATLRVRAVSDNSIIGTLGTYDLANCTNGAYFTITGVPVVIPSGDVRLSLEIESTMNPSNYITLQVAAHEINGGYSYWNGSTWTDSTAELKCKYILTAASTSAVVATGEHNIKVTADGSDLKLYVDTILQDTESLAGASVPNNANNWFYCPSGITPYTDYYKHTVSGTLITHYQPVTIISGTTLPDREGTAQNGTITWGSNPAGLTVGLSPLIATDSTISGGSTSVGSGTSGLGNIGAGNIQSIDDRTNPGTFLDPLINVIADAMDLPNTLVWLGLYIIALLFVFMTMARLIPVSLLPAGVSSVVVSLIFYLIGVLDWYVVAFGVVVTGACAAIDSRQSI